MKKDILIIGGGVSALSASLFLPKDLNTLIITKSDYQECNSYWAQGGVAVALNKDDVKKHVKDTIKAGAYRNDKKAVEVLSNLSIGAIETLIKNGMSFDKDEEGNLLYTREGAHSRNRILHAGGDATGKVLYNFLKEQNKFPILKATVVDILIENSVCYGITVINNQKLENIYADNIIIASGGFGSLFLYSTNAQGIDGEIQGLCYEKGLPLRDMHMLQFHPTVLDDNSQDQKFLLSEALRGEGAKIVDEDDYAFIKEYDKRGDLASRDVISRSIFHYKQKTNKKIFLDLTKFDQEWFKNRFPTIYSKLISLGFDIPKEKIPISPAFHYAMGGIKTDLNGKVEGFENLYALGEVASNGVHGANRLASNSLLEGIVFAKVIKEEIIKNNFKSNIKEFVPNTKFLDLKFDKELDFELKKLMWESAGIIRTKKDLLFAMEKINTFIHNNPPRKNILKLFLAKSIIQDALAQELSQGAHYII